MDRFERHDIINALVLALVLLVMALALSFLGGKLLDTVQDDGIIDSVKPEEIDESALVTSTTSTTEVTTTTTEAALVHPPAEVKVVVVNSARVRGIATKGSNTLKPVGYQVLSPTNGDTIGESVVYYVEGFEGDAIQVATLLGMSEEAIAPMPDTLSFSPGEAHLAAVIGGDNNL